MGGDFIVNNGYFDPQLPVPATWDEVLRHPAVEVAEFFPDRLGVVGGWYVRLRAGYCLRVDGTHIGIGRSVEEVISVTFPVIGCNCRKCRDLGEGRKGGRDE